MNKTISVNISGLVFNIEEEAYNSLRQYLDTLRRNFSGSQGGDEIMRDIESRIAELFQERLANTRQVITMEDVDYIKTVMGQPEAYFEEEAASDNTSGTTWQQPAGTRRKRIFRDTDNRILGGVCSGLAAYFGWDPLLVRLVFVILVLGFGVGIIPYIILWIIIPKAITTADKLEMYGEPVTAENISRAVNQGFQDIKGRFGKGRWPGKPNGNGYNSVRSGLNTAVDFSESLLQRLIRFVGRVLGFLMLFAGAIFLTGTLVAVFGIQTMLPFPGAADMSALDWAGVLYPSDTTAALALAGTLLMALIPAVALILGGLHLGLNLRARRAGLIGLVLLALFLTGIVFSAISGIAVGTDFTQEAEVQTPLTVPAVGDTMYVNLQTRPIQTKLAGKGTIRLNGQDNDWFYIENDTLYAQELRVYIERSAQQQLVCDMITEAHGRTLERAAERASNVRYTAGFSGDTLYFQPFVGYHRNDRFREQEAELRVYIPDSQVVVFSPGTTRKINSVDVVPGENFWDNRDEYWMMTPEGLRCISCPEQNASSDSTATLEVEQADIEWSDENGARVEIKVRKES